MPPQKPKLAIQLPKIPNPSIPTVGPISRWELVSKMLDMRKLAITLADDPSTKPAQMWDMLATFDVSSTVRNRLIRTEMERTPRVFWEITLNLYIAACVTGMLRKTGVLTHLEHSGLVIFPEPEIGTADNDRGQQTPKLKPTGYTGIVPSLWPIERELPDFNGAFLKILQTRLEKALATRNLHPSADGGRTNPDKRIREAVKRFIEQRQFRVTEAATEQYLGQVYKRKDPGFVADIVSSGGPYVFMWLKTLGLLDDVVEGLMRSKPLIPMAGTSNEEGMSMAGPTRARI